MNDIAVRGFTELNIYPVMYYLRRLAELFSLRILNYGQMFTKPLPL
jgi:hypothetical protein